MNDFLLQKVPIKEIDESRASNISNGNDAEIYSASQMLTALGAEVSWGSRNEDGRKIDLIASYDHPWFEKERIIFLVQVKSGTSYGVKLANGFKLLSSAKKAAQRTSHPICIVWVDRDTKKTYWAYIHPNSTANNQIYKENHLITPAMRFDIARSQAKFLPRKIGGAGIIITNKTNTLQEKRQLALSNYKLLKKKKIICPNLGEVEFTRVGWRHMFRKSRAAENKDTSLIVINYLHHILTDKPSSIYVSDLKIKDILDFTYRKCEYILSYEQVKNIKGEKIKVIIRLIEEIRWPKEWNSHACLSQQVDRKLTFLSCYYKK
jgi:hypothetical protein